MKREAVLQAMTFINGKHRTKKNAVVLFDRVFVYLNAATTIAAVMRTQGRNSSGKRARSPKKKLDFKPSLV